ncbi:MAG TPA: FecR domain-containing protein [Chryseolinea sp.]|nr:FecR domain-containing protein [Chryseolinea sp.]
MDYKNYSTEDFICDEFFQQWVRTPDTEKDKYWATFLEQFPWQRSNVEEARQFLSLMKSEGHAPDPMIHTMQVRINDAIDKLEHAKRISESNTPLVTMTPPKERFAIAYRIAASVILIASVIGYYTYQKNEGTGFKKSVYTHEGNKMNIVLPDETKVWLNADSRLTYASDFMAGEDRQVYLEGEAFFDVTPDASRPFIVSTSGIAVKVLGTAFNVKSYPNDQKIQTTVVRGKVSVESTGKKNGQLVMLSPNQRAVFTKESEKIVREEKVDSEEDTLWKDGWIIFDDKPFGYIIETLERWYNVKIIMEDSYSLTCTFSAKFKDKSLEEVLDIFKNTESINYTIDGSKVSITGRLCEY